ncbi:MAG: hypothetical protein JO105_22705 [Hyphomicrobiales bacterium]|nr:hypothetical protein [Hyphomicrobiales bacterium]
MTPRQKDVALLLADDLPVRAVARELGLAEDTVKVHIRGLRRTLALQPGHRAGVVICRMAARREGWDLEGAVAKMIAAM